MKSSYRAGRWNGHAEHEQRDDQKRTGERHGKLKCDRRRPDAGGNRQPQRKRPQERHQQPAGAPNGAEPARELLGDARDRRRERRNDPGEPLGGAAEPLGVARQDEENHE